MPTTTRPPRCSTSTPDGYREPTAKFIDGVSYDGKAPNAYIDSQVIGLKGDQTVVGGAVTN